MGKYQEDGRLPVLAQEILNHYKGEELNAAKSFQWRVIFTDSSLGINEPAGKCRKIDGAISYLWHVDFLILIHRQTWDGLTNQQKTHLLVHELHHIAVGDNDEPKIRPHAGDFCEIAAHDKTCQRIASEIWRDLKNLEGFNKQIEIVTA